ncbi:MAG: ImmA/IrrE family metallo-endopeptidase [bacterium]
MDYGKIKVPYIKNKEIKIKAEEFRVKYWDKNLPIDIEKIVDLNLRINIIPLLELEKMCDANALIASNWETLYIDKDLFEDERRQNRLRFSLAHEIGHFILHKDFYKALDINSIDDFYNFIDIIPGEQYGYLETQANKFAGYLLIPFDLLEKEFFKNLEEVKTKIDIDRFDKLLIKSCISEPLSKKFGVSQETMEIILGELDFFKK